MKSGKDGDSADIRDRYKPVSRYIAITLLILAACIICAGCLSENSSIAAASGIGSGQPDSSGLYLYQNVVNTSGGRESYDNSSASFIGQRAAAIRDAIDVNNPATRDYAVSIIPRAHGGTFNLAQVCDVWENVYRTWTYVDDPRGSEYFSPASRTIALGLKGDCDDFAIAVAAMIESVGGSARIVTAQNSTSGHAYPELYIGNSSAKFEEAAAYIRQRYHVTDVGCHITRGEDGNRYWLNLDWWSRHPGGRFFADDGERIAYYPDGRWEMVESAADHVPEPAKQGS
ncbi:transglutaminase domain-containing protein [Methanoregula sp.]|uniref:transglutaminase domain-containing protein n=1 Tax=Methanoregula sp. TaxID=2052170 RepID=UPI0026237FC1|nr:transglutaminase domain-containing protein [Methanoregula sp.]MDD5142772.1 transglutaminase domain-containing protein [Methanoregula sp.]